MYKWDEYKKYILTKTNKVCQKTNTDNKLFYYNIAKHITQKVELMAYLPPTTYHLKHYNQIGKLLRINAIM